MSRDTDSPGAEFKIAIGGPVVTLLIAAACVGAGMAVGGDEFWDAMRLSRERRHLGRARAAGVAGDDQRLRPRAST